MSIIHAGWALLNFALLIGVFVVSYRNYRVFSERFGPIASGLLILVLASTCHSSRNKSVDPATASQLSTTVYSADRASYEGNIVLYGGAVFRIRQQLSIQPTDNNADSLRISSYVSASGLVMGTSWQSMYTTANLLPGRRASYLSTGTLTWYLLGIPLYVQLKQFKGDVSLAGL